MAKYDVIRSILGGSLGLDGAQDSSGRSAPFLTGDGFQGLRIGQRDGADYKIGSPVAFNELYDDFLGATLSTRWATAKGSDAGAAYPVIAAALGGAINCVTGAGAGATMAVNGTQLHSALNWQANKGNLRLEAKVKLSAITNVALFVGFTDQVSSLEMPVNGSGTADGLTTTATDAVGFLFDTTMTTKKFWLTGVANDVDATAQNSAIAPVADTYNTLRVEVGATGIARFFIDGALVGTSLSGSTRATVPLTPVVAAFARAAAARTVSVDKILVQQTAA